MLSFTLLPAQRTRGNSTHEEEQVYRLRSISMTPTPVPALPPELIARIMRAALAAEGSTAHGRLSLVCGAWRDTLRSAHCVGLVIVACTCNA